MTASEIARSMTDEQAKKAAQAMRADDVEGARAVMETMTREELRTFIALLDAVLAERRVTA